MPLAWKRAGEKGDAFRTKKAPPQGPHEPERPGPPSECVDPDFAWRKPCGSPPNYPGTPGCMLSSTHPYMSIHDHPHKRKGEARCQEFVAAPWRRFGHTCCSEAPRPRRTSVAACTCRARKRIKLSAKRRTEVSSRSSRTSTRTTTTALSRGTSTPRTASTCGSATNSGFEADTARACLRHGGGGGAGGAERRLFTRS